ncbi:TonB-dependent Receptor Plug Domain [Dyella jiangningensis]|uniref:TonB-dependent receptor domain-containing protein n=1 Tax=Dyella sp. AtDHG13 TaxID=1938897 RepID=UPI00088574DB|nr:TonB-dependent receptor [Dyella sp. AtDHG13]PXV59550.1 TonB-dependent receptor-like protein [Dyella sp. AtDHG13]SDJ13581.1 TonB-dependent Receptor Plug Domain [Dyella jiangningensis]
MQSNYNRLSIAVRLALSVGIASTAAMAQAQDATTNKDASSAQNTQGQSTTEQPKQSSAKTLTAVSVTGSLIRRVDAETASPVVTLDRSAITNNGSPTLGNVLQQLPSVAGNATNTQNNSNGGGGASPTLEGGDGAARVSLRGLGINRTLVLVDGQRLANADLNMIPQNMVERVDVLAEGASTVYGSDAIGGVVNFILRKDYKGAELSVNDGISDHGDGQRRGAQFTIGASGDQGNIVAGVDYNKYNPVLAPRRDFSARQLYLYNGGPQPSGSHTIPTGRLLVPATNPPGDRTPGGCEINSQGNAYVTLANGTGNSLSNYRCFSNANDTYNYNAYNYIQQQQERTNVFVLGNYKFNDYVTFFGEAFYNHTNSAGQDAPAPTGVGDGWHVLASNPNNPFGVTFSQGTLVDPAAPGADSGYAFNTRLTGLGTRLHTFTTTNEQVNAGLRGNFGQSSWIWDASVDYGHTRRVQTNYNEVNVPAFQAAIDAGANIFDQANPAVTALLRKGVDAPQYTLTNTMKQAQANASGELWDLPAGAMQLSVGALYRKTSMSYNVTADAVLDPTTNTCVVLSEACGSPGGGSDSVKELYAETLIPLLSEQPFAYSLNVDVGLRYSDYDSSGNTTNGKIAIEYRPIADLLMRGTVSQVFRAPNMDELYDGRTVAGPNLTDPCVHLTTAQLAQHAAACQNVPQNWSGNPIGQVTAYYSGAAAIGSKLKPEQGKSIDIGLVYSPSWLEGLSSSLDFWHIYLTDTLTPIQAQTVVNACFNNNNSPYCSYINRYDQTNKLAGAVNYINTPVVNLGNLSTSGIDFTLNYAIPHFDIGSVDPGNFKAGLNSTYVSTYKNDASPGQPGAETINYAGTYGLQFGNIPRFRGTFTLNWALGPWSAQWQSRFISRVSNLNANLDTGATAPMASVLYHSIQAGYEWSKIHTRFDLGIDNLSNKIPPLSYQNGSNYNVDTATYDVMGRYYWARATVKF